MYSRIKKEIINKWIEKLDLVFITPLFLLLIIPFFVIFFHSEKLVDFFLYLNIDFDFKQFTFISISVIVLISIINLLKLFIRDQKFQNVLKILIFLRIIFNFSLIIIISVLLKIFDNLIFYNLLPHIFMGIFIFSIWMIIIDLILSFIRYFSNKEKKVNKKDEIINEKNVFELSSFYRILLNTKKLKNTSPEISIINFRIFSEKIFFIILIFLCFLIVGFPVGILAFLESSTNSGNDLLLELISFIPSSMSIITIFVAFLTLDNVEKLNFKKMNFLEKTKFVSEYIDEKWSYKILNVIEEKEGTSEKELIFIELAKFKIAFMESNQILINDPGLKLNLSGDISSKYGIYSLKEKNDNKIKEIVFKNIKFDFKNISIVNLYKIFITIFMFINSCFDVEGINKNG